MICTTWLLNQTCGPRVLWLEYDITICIGTRGRALDLLNHGAKKRKKPER